MYKHTDRQTEQLQKINRVDVPSFLFTRIIARIRVLDAGAAPLSWRWAFAVTAIFLIMLNLTVMVKSTPVKKNNGLSDVISSMHLSSSNNLYDE